MSVENLLSPLAGAAPTGADLSFSRDFDAIAEMRRADDPTLSQGEWVSEVKTADWPGVASACETLLAQRTKDLRVAGWLAEAWAQLRGYAGLADGIALAQGLCERYWASLHPLPEGEDIDLRTGALAHLLTQVVQLGAALPVLRRGDAAYSLLDIDAARALGVVLATARDPGAVPTAGKATPEDIAKALRETPASALVEHLEHGRRTREALLALQAVVDGHLGADGPAFGAARSTLDDSVHALERLVRGVSSPITAPPVAAASPEAPVAATLTAPAFGAQPTTRAQALAQLRLVAEYFRTHEPHSPVAYLAERAAHWGELPLHEWLRLVMKDGGSLVQLEELLGVETRH
ncbi:type VI secretion system protein TssA [Rubrivivax gelatinosus]|nr:type VI secretion system protein TssA [Rubrivivax gelatinosus]